MNKCQHALLAAIELAPRNPVYYQTADQVFTCVAAFTWQVTELQQASARLQPQFETVCPC